MRKKNERLSFRKTFTIVTSTIVTAFIAAVFSLSIVFSLSAPPCFAQSIPPYINYQGRLTDQATGGPVNGVKSITFSLYDTATGGTSIYSQTQRVNIVNGTFSVYVGKGEGSYSGSKVADGIPAEVFTEHSARYLGIKIADSSTEMTPRQSIASVAYAYQAEKARIAESVMGQVMVDSASGNVGVGAANPNEKLTVSGTISLQEQDSSPSVTAGYGKLYARPMTAPDQYTKLLLHMDGPSGSTIFTDVIDSGHKVSAKGDAQMSTSKSKFGGASAYFDGQGDYLSIPASDDWNFGTGDFTIDFWVYPTVASGPNYPRYCVIKGVLSLYSGDTNCREVYVGWADGGLSFRWAVEDHLNEWSHLALVRQNGNFLLFVNGAQQTIARGSQPSASKSFSGNAELQIGCLDPDRYCSTGYFDEFRISKGIARWTANFIPPNAPYATGGLYYKDSSGNEISISNSSGGTGSSLWGQSSSDIYYNSGNVGIGTMIPYNNSKLHVNGAVRIDLTTLGQSQGIPLCIGPDNRICQCGKCQ